MIKTSRGTSLLKSEQVFKIALAMVSTHIFNAKSVWHSQVRMSPGTILHVNPCILPGMPFLEMMVEGSSGEVRFALVFSFSILECQRSLCPTKLY